MTSNKVMVGLPTLSFVHTLLAATLIQWVIDKKVNLKFFATTNVQPVDKARNDVVETFLASDCTHLLFIDSDTVPPTDALYKLLKADKPIVSALTPIIRADKENDTYKRVWNCVGMDDEHLQPNTGILPIKGAGSSCILIKREVFEALEKPYYEFLYKDDEGRPCEVGEDIYFIIKAIGKGIGAYADTSIVCQHYKASLW